MTKEEVDPTPESPPASPPPKEATVKKNKSDGKGSSSSSSSSSSNKKSKAAAKLQKEKKEAVKRLLKDELKKEIKPLVLGSIAMLFSSASNQAVPRLLGKILDQKSKKSSSAPTCPNNNYNINYLLLIVVGGGLSSFLRTTMLNRAQEGIASSLRSQLFRTLLIDRDVEWYNLDPKAHESNDNDDEGEKNDKKTKSTKDSSTDKISSVDDDDDDEEKEESSSASSSSSPNLPSSTLSSHSPSAIQSILTKDVETVSSTITTTLADTFRSTCSVVFATKNMFDIDPNLLTMSLGVVPIIGSAAVILNKFVKKVTSQYHDIIMQAEEFATERIDHIATVKTSNRQYDEIEKYHDMQSRARTLSHKASLAKGIFMGFMFSSSSSALVLLFHMGGKSVASGRMTFGELKSFATFTFMLGLGTSGVIKGLGQIVQGMVCAERLYDLMDGNCDKNVDNENLEEKKVPEDKNIKSDSVESVSLSNVNFAYATNPSNDVLRNITLSICRGKVVALAGANGSGKSTIASILVALYKPRSGQVTMNTADKIIDYYSFNREIQSSLVQLVPQQPVMFDMTIKENITYTNPNASEDEIRNALDASNCSTFINKLQDGLDYRVGRNGCKLSGGQKQRLALARALLCDPALLILDEPNSSMDAEGDNAVADAVMNCRSEGSNSNKRGLLLITHSATSLELADEIIVLKDGEIVEQGSYDKLTGNKQSALCALMPDLK